jgi:hypothetical protein
MTGIWDVKYPSESVSGSTSRLPVNHSSHSVLRCGNAVGFHPACHAKITDKPCCPLTTHARAAP